MEPGPRVLAPHKKIKQITQQLNLQHRNRLGRGLTQVEQLEIAFVHCVKLAQNQTRLIERIHPRIDVFRWKRDLEILLMSNLRLQRRQISGNSFARGLE